MPPLRPPSSPFLPLPLFQCRHIHSTRPLLRRPMRDTLPPLAEPIPTYPHGPNKWYKQSNRGLYGNLSIRSGNIVSEQNQIKTKRLWRPNIHNKRLWSESLDRFVRVRIATRVLRTIDKVGGLDSYLMGDGKGRVRELGVWGWALRWRVWQSERARERREGERKRLGLEGRAPWEEAERLLGVLREKGFVPKVGAEEGRGRVVEGGKEESGEEVAARMEREIDEQLDMDDEAAKEGEMSLNEDLFEEEKPGKGR